MTLPSDSTSPGTVSGTDSESSSVSSDGQDWYVLRPESLWPGGGSLLCGTIALVQFCYHHWGSECCGSETLRSDLVLLSISEDSPHWSSLCCGGNCLIQASCYNVMLPLQSRASTSWIWGLPGPKCSLDSGDPWTLLWWTSLVGDAV